MKINIQIISIISLLCFWACQSEPENPGLFAEITTEKGVIRASLDHEKAPLTVSNFVGLAEGTIKNSFKPEGVPYYDGLRFPRVAPNHVIQTGGDDAGLGYTFPNEIHPELKHDGPGVLGMANGGPHTNGSSFYITFQARSYLDGDYTVFGHVTEGMDVVNKIEPNDIIISIRIFREGKRAAAFKVTNESFFKMVEAAKIRVKQEFENKVAKEAELIRTNWPDAIETESGIIYQVKIPGTGEPGKPKESLSFHYVCQSLYGQKFFNTPKEGVPIDYIIGETKVIPGLKEPFEQMVVGEKRLVILKPHLAYGQSGYYKKEEGHKMRVTISPNTTLVYEVERIK